MESTNQGQILDEAVRILLCALSLEKCMNTSLLPPGIDA